MAMVTVKQSGATPANPPAGYLRLFADGNTWKYVNSSGTVFTLSTGITPEEVQDIIGAALADTSTVNLTYNDAGDVITADVIPGGVNHDALLNFVANEHVDHSAVAVNAGSGLTGGGDLTATRTISMPNVGTPGTYRSVTTDAQGRVTSGTNPTTLAGYGITDAQPLDGDLTAVSALTGTGIVARTAANAYATRSIAAGTGLSVTNGDAVAGNPSVAIANTGVTSGTYGNATQFPVITVNAQGQITAVSEQIVSAVFGSEFEDFEDLTTATTTSTTFSAGATFTTAAKPVGRYRVDVFFNWSINVTNADARFRLIVDGTQVGPEMRIEVSETANQSNWDSGFVFVDFASAATHTIALEFAVENGGNVLSLFQTRSSIWRVS